MTPQSVIEVVIADRRSDGSGPRNVHAHGVFPDEAAATGFVRNQLAALPLRGVTDVHVSLTALGASDTARPLRDVSGAVATVAAEFDTAPAVERDLAATLTRAARSRRVDVAAVLERAAATAAANVGGADLLLAASPESVAAHHVSALAGLGTDPELPLLRRTEPVVLYFETRDQQLDDYGIRELCTRDTVAIRAELRRAELDGGPRAELEAELAAVQTLYETDVEAYVATWIAAATSRARDLGLPDDVPVLLSTDDTESYDDGDLEPLYDYAFATVALPGCGYTPTTYPHRDTGGMPDVEAFVDAERTAHRSYRDRVAATRDGRRVPT
ncbi:hypothetical protein [Rhodococcoides kroppenstedtii]|uniref:hypothetical protein n=1 Tax=Rhodococcoides kroppenstedtii TaxID=293050 RepID=UPI00363DD6D7